MKKFPKQFSKEFADLKKLNTPEKIQDYLNQIPQNFSIYTCRSPKGVLKYQKASCLEGAMLGAVLLWQNGEQPLLLDLEAIKPDVAHVLALFKRDGLWGALSKTNYSVLRYRDPIFRNVRELALSYFNEYFLNDGEKTLRSYSAPFDLSRLDSDWVVSDKYLWEIETALEKSPHFDIAPKSTIKKLRLADKIEIRAGMLKEWKRKPNPKN